MHITTIFTHALVPVAAAAASKRISLSSRVLIVSMLAAILPDADVLGLQFGIPYESQWGHRGFTHSFAFAAFVGLVGAACAPSLKTSRWCAFILLFFSTASHPLLDSLTNGGLGVAFFWPFDHTRYFMPWQPIEVSPIGARNFFTARGAAVLLSELLWVLIPLGAIAFISRLLNKPERIKKHPPSTKKDG